MVKTAGMQQQSEIVGTQQLELAGHMMNIYNQMAVRVYVNILGWHVVLLMFIFE